MAEYFTDEELYLRLLDINDYFRTNNDMILIDYEFKRASVFTLDHDKIPMNKGKRMQESPMEKVDPIILKVITVLGMQPIGSMVPLMLFVQTKNDIIDEMKLREKQRLDAIRAYQGELNKEVANKEYYHAFLGNDLIKTMSDLSLKAFLHDFRMLRRERLEELHRLQKIMYHRFRKGLPSWKGIDADKGFAQSFNIKLDPATINEFMNPLAEINLHYCKYKIHALEVELCYINCNTKVIGKELRRRSDLKKVKTNAKNSRELANEMLDDKYSACILENELEDGRVVQQVVESEDRKDERRRLNRKLDRAEDLVRNKAALFDDCTSFDKIDRSKVQQALEDRLPIYVYNKSKGDYQIIGCYDFRHCYISDIIDEVISRMVAKANESAGGGY